MKNRVIAITGQSGSGKSTVSKYYNQKGYKVIDCDEIVKTVHDNIECQKELSKEFGEDIIENGKINKFILTKKAFQDEKTLQRLTDITHPFIIYDILKLIKEYHSQGNNIVFVDGAVIIGHEFEKYCDTFIVVHSECDAQIERIMKRDNISHEKAEARIRKQTSYKEMFLKADYVINNNQNFNYLIQKSDEVLKDIIEIK